MGACANTELHRLALLQEGHPLTIHTVDGINMPELYKHVSPERLWEIVITTTEMLPREGLQAISRAIGRPVDESFGSLNMVDLRAFRMWHSLCTSQRPVEGVSLQVQPILADTEPRAGGLQDGR